MKFDSVAPTVSRCVARSICRYIALFAVVGTITVSLLSFQFLTKDTFSETTTNETKTVAINNTVDPNVTNETVVNVSSDVPLPLPPVPVPWPNRTFVVFLGDSVTLGWRNFTLPYGNPMYINRGWSGHTTIRMKARLQNDVLRHEPAVAVIMGGLNDLGGNDGYYPTNDEIFANLAWMADRSVASGSKVCLCSITPMIRYGNKTGVPPPERRIISINNLLQSFANETYGVHYVDYWSSLHGEDYGLLPQYTSDGVHLTTEGYSVIEPIITNCLFQPCRVR